MGRWDVFISFAQRDGLADARRIRERLRAAGLNVWLDEERIESRGEPLFSAALSEGLVEASTCIVLCSLHATSSQWVTDELKLFVLVSRSDPGTARVCLVALDERSTEHFSLQVRTFSEALRTRVSVQVLRANEIDEFAASLSKDAVRYVLSSEERRELLDDSGEISAERLRAVKNYWDQNNYMKRAGWDTPDLTTLLTAFDGYGYFYGDWLAQNGDTSSPGSEQFSIVSCGANSTFESRTCLHNSKPYVSGGMKCSRGWPTAAVR